VREVFAQELARIVEDLAAAGAAAGTQDRFARAAETASEVYTAPSFRPFLTCPPGRAIGDAEQDHGNGVAPFHDIGASEAPGGLAR